MLPASHAQLETMCSLKLRQLPLPVVQFWQLPQPPLMDLQADEFAAVDLSPEKSSVNKERSNRPLGEECFKGLTSAPIIFVYQSSNW